MVSTLFHLVEGMPGKPLVARFGPIRLPCLTMSLLILSNFHGLDFVPSCRGMPGKPLVARFGPIRLPCLTMSLLILSNFHGLDFVPSCRGDAREATGSSVWSDTASLSHNEPFNFVKFSWSRLCSIL